MTSTSPEQLAAELRDASGCLRRVPTRCLRDGVALVEYHADLAKRLERVAAILAPRTTAALAAAAASAGQVRPETRFTPGTISGPSGNLIRVERRRRAA